MLGNMNDRVGSLAAMCPFKNKQEVVIQKITLST